MTAVKNTFVVSQSYNIVEIQKCLLCSNIEAYKIHWKLFYLFITKWL